MDELFLKPDTVLVVSQLAKVELNSAFYRRFRMGEISEEALLAAVNSFKNDCQSRFDVKALLPCHYDKATELLATHGKTKSLRTLDALQLAIHLSEVSTATFVCADERLIEIAKAENCSTLNPS